MQESKRVRTCVGLALLAAFVPQVGAQQPRAPEVGQAIRPIEQFSIERAAQEWNDVLQPRASSPSMPLFGLEPGARLEPPMPEVARVLCSSLMIDRLSLMNIGSRGLVAGVRSPISPAASLLLPPPVITVQPSPVSKTVNTGVTVVYTVTATGALNYQWRKRPLVPFAPFVAIPGATGPSLTLSPVKASDAGAYKCRVTNASGGVTTSVVRLIVL